MATHPLEPPASAIEPLFNSRCSCSTGFLAKTLTGHGPECPTRRPYYDEDGIQIWHADCRQLDAWLAADVLITDPPYGIDWQPPGSVGNGNHGPAIAGDTTTDTRDAALHLWGDERPWIMFGSLKAPLPPRWRQALVFHKDCHNAGLVGVRRPWRNNWEPVFVGGRWPDQTPNLDGVVRTYEMATTGYSGYVTRAGHPHAKPLDVMLQLMRATPVGATVADPFMGSGTTLLAAKRLGRRAIGVEVEERYCELAASRMAQGVLDLEEWGDGMEPLSDSPQDHDVFIKYFGVLPYGYCDVCKWEGPTRDREREAADDAREHARG